LPVPHASGKSASAISKAEQETAPLSAPFQASNLSGYTQEPSPPSAHVTNFQPWPTSEYQDCSPVISQNIMAQFTGAKSWAGSVSPAFGSSIQQSQEVSEHTSIPTLPANSPLQHELSHAKFAQYHLPVTQPAVSDRFLKLVDTVCNDLHRLGVRDVTVSMFEQHFARMRNGKKVAYRKLGFASMEHLFMTQQPHFVVTSLADGTLGVRTQAYAAYLLQLQAAQKRGGEMQLPEFGANVPPMRPSAPAQMPALTAYYGAPDHATPTSPPAPRNARFSGPGYPVGREASSGTYYARPYHPAVPQPLSYGMHQPPPPSHPSPWGDVNSAAFPAPQPMPPLYMDAHAQYGQPQSQLYFHAPPSSLGGRSGSSDSGAFGPPSLAPGSQDPPRSSGNSIGMPLWGSALQPHPTPQQGGSIHGGPPIQGGVHASAPMGGTQVFAGYNAWPPPRGQ
jgi:hypothetical protein